MPASLYFLLKSLVSDDAEEIFEKADCLIAEAKDMCSKANERMKEATNDAKCAVDEFVACAVTINMTIIDQWSGRMRELQICHGLTEADVSAQMGLLCRIVQESGECAEALVARSIKAPAVKVDLLALIKPPTLPMAPVKPLPDMIIPYSERLERAKSYLQQAEEYFGHAKALTQALRRDEQMLRRVTSNASRGTDVLNALAGRVTELTLDLMQSPERSDSATSEDCIMRASRAVRAIADIIGAPMLDESGVTDDFITAVLRGQLILEEIS